MARILLIDDDVGVTAVLQRMLVGAGHVVQAAASGKAGVASYRQQPSDVVITDIVMPDMEGLEVIRQLRRHDPEVKIIAMSGGGLGSAGNYLDVARKFGARWVLSKPFTQHEVLAIVDQALAYSGAG